MQPAPPSNAHRMQFGTINPYVIGLLRIILLAGVFLSNRIVLVSFPMATFVVILMALVAWALIAFHEAFRLAPTLLGLFVVVLVENYSVRAGIHLLTPALASMALMASLARRLHQPRYLRVPSGVTDAVILESVIGELLLQALTYPRGIRFELMLCNDPFQLHASLSEPLLGLTWRVLALRAAVYLFGNLALVLFAIVTTRCHKSHAATRPRTLLAQNRAGLILRFVLITALVALTQFESSATSYVAATILLIALIALPPSPVRTIWPLPFALLLITAISPYWSFLAAKDRSTTIARILFADSSSACFAPPAADWSIHCTKPQFSSFRALLDDQGFATATTPPENLTSSLTGTDVVVLTNFNKLLTSDDVAELHRFVNSGGSLLVLCDHTDIAGQCAPVNRITSDLGIRLNFDSAIPFGNDWTWMDKLQLLRHPMTSGIPPTTDLGLSVGASLSLSKNALPIILGERAFSDAGNRSNSQAFLGNTRPDCGETIGGLVLVAETRLGNGKIVVFGDTSTFQDASIPRTSEFVLRTLRYLTSPESSRRFGVLIVAIALSAGYLSLYWLARIAFLDGLPSAVIILGTIYFAAADEPASGALVNFNNVVLVSTDTMRCGSTRATDRDSLSGLESGLRRYGYFPIESRFEALDSTYICRASGFVFQAPMSDLPPPKLSAIHRAIDAGAWLWVFAGIREVRRAPNLFHEFRMSVDQPPLAGTLNSQDDQLDFLEPWPVRLENGHSLVSRFGRDVISSAKFGAGHIVLVGDPAVFLGKGLEQKWKVNRKNATVFSAMLETCRSAR